MKITIVQGSFLPVPPLIGGAVEKVWFALGKEFVRQGHHVTHISRRFKSLPNEEWIARVRHLRVAGFDTPSSLIRLKLFDLFYSLRVWRMLPPGDIVVTNTFWLPLLIRSRRFGRLYINIQRFPKGQMRFYSHAARLQTVSTHVRSAILREVPQMADKTITIPNPISEVAHCPSRSTREPWILYVGRVHPEKGIALLIEAANLLFKTRIEANWRFIVVGPTSIMAGGGGESYAAALRDLAAPIKDRVDWVGPVFDSDCLSEYYERSSIFVYPSLAERGETFGLAPVEAMAHGCPPVVSDLECFRDYLHDSVTGFVFNHRTATPAAELAAKLEALIADPARLAAVGEAARRKAREYSLDRVAGQYLADFEAVLATR